VGYLATVVETEHRQARIGDLVVAPAFRRKGIGEKLLEHAIAWCLRRNVEQIVLECTLKAQPAIAFAQKHRFVACGFQKHIGPDRSGVIFRKRIEHFAGMIWLMLDDAGVRYYELARAALWATTF
jgi:GNAT superfamily N-acetyltransferase